MRGTEKYNLHFGPSDANYWLAEPGVPEPDDWLHNPDVEDGNKESRLRAGGMLTRRVSRACRWGGGWRGRS